MTGVTRRYYIATMPQWPAQATQDDARRHLRDAAGVSWTRFGDLGSRMRVVSVERDRAVVEIEHSRNDELAPAVLEMIVHPPQPAHLVRWIVGGSTLDDPEATRFALPVLGEVPPGE